MPVSIFSAQPENCSKDKAEHSENSCDQSSLPPKGSRPLAWPLDTVHITGKFGKTKSNKRLYRNGWHSGVDFRAKTPLPIKSSANGVIAGTGNTDVACKNASFGKWVLIRHDNGLSTLYAHMSSIKVRKWQKISTGDIIGYTGNTGYSTAAHLHMSVYKSAGVKIRAMPSKVCLGKTYILPRTAPDTHLDPLAYLPEL